MVQNDSISTSIPLFSVIIAVYNDWAPLEQCLQSLEQQTDSPAFEVIVVDDGSVETAPDSIRQRTGHYPLTVARQPHAGIPTARNRGVQISKGSVLVFTDADCRFQVECLATLAAMIADSPQQNCFQLHLIGDYSSLVGRAEELRLVTLQNQLLQSDGRIRYLNTAGFAIRRRRIDFERGLFDPVALRAEDTLLLVSLMEGGELPLFVAKATIQHFVPLGLLESLRKAIRSACLETRTYDIIESKGVRIRVSSRDRTAMLLSMWKTSGGSSIGRLAWFVLVLRQALARIVSVAYRCLTVRSKSHAS